MRLSARKKSAVLLSVLLLMTTATDGVSSPTPARPALPTPSLVFMGQELYTANGKEWIRYNYSVVNQEEYPDELFAAAPDLPPCGSNTKSSRTWVDIYDSSGKRLYGFCALGSNDGLGRLWFALEPNAIPPSWVYVELNDRKTATKYKSNLAETTL